MMYSMFSFSMREKYELTCAAWISLRQAWTSDSAAPQHTTDPWLKKKISPPLSRKVWITWKSSFLDNHVRSYFFFKISLRVLKSKLSAAAYAMHPCLYMWLIKDQGKKGKEEEEEEDEDEDEPQSCLALFPCLCKCPGRAAFPAVEEPASRASSASTQKKERGKGNNEAEGEEDQDQEEVGYAGL